MKRTELPMVHVYYVESLRISAPQAAVQGSKSYAELVLDMRRFDWTLFLVLRIVASICVIGQVTGHTPWGVAVLCAVLAGVIACRVGADNTSNFITADEGANPMTNLSSHCNEVVSSEWT